MSNDKDDNKRKRADKYDEKVKFDGTFEDMVQMSFNKPKSYKYAVGDIVKYKGKKYTIASVNTDGELFDYLISASESDSPAPFGVKEQDLEATD